jgi:PAS domain S-box-containing protein
MADVPAPWPRLDRRVAGGTAAVVAVLFGLHVLPQGPTAQRTSDVLQVVLALAAAAAAGRATLRGNGKSRLFWGMVTLATVCWATGQLLFTLESTALFPTESSALQRGLFLVAAFPMAVAGLVRPDRPGASRVLVIVDIALLAGLVLFVYFYFNAATSPGDPGFHTWRQLATICQTIVVATTLVPLAFLAGNPWTSTYRQVTAAALLWFGGNAMTAPAFLAGNYRAGLWDIPWSVPFVWLALAAARWSQPPAADAAVLEQPWKDTRRGLTLALATVGMVPTLHMLTTLVVPMTPELVQRRTAMALVCLVLLGILFATRQLLVVRNAQAAEAERSRELERIDARFQQAFRHSPAAMAIVSHDELRVVDVNDRCCELLGLPRPSILGARTADLLIRTPDRGHESLELMLSARRTRSAVPLRFHTRAGAPVETLVSLEPIEIDARPATLVLIEDVRERKGLEERLITAQKMDAIGRLAGGIAHEFNNLLTAIMNAGSLARGEIDRPALVSGHLDRIDRASERAASLTRQLLAFGRRQALRPELLDVAAVVEEMRSLLPSVLGEDVRLEIDAAPSLPPVRADRAQLRQVILNLAANARDAMPRGGRLSIAVAAAANGHRPAVVLRVIDTGIGMSEQVQQHLFEPFFTTKAPAERGGLGLAAVYGIVAQSGGAIDVDSAPGRGTTVSIVLPAGVEGEAPR